MFDTAGHRPKTLIGLIILLVSLPVIVLAISVRTLIAPRAVAPEKLTPSQRQLLTSPSFSTFARLTQTLLTQEISRAPVRRQSTSLGYQLSYHRSIWQEETITFELPGVETFSLSLRREYGYGSLSIAASTPQQFQSALAARKTQAGTAVSNLDAAALALERQIVGLATLLDKERTTIGATDAYRFSVAEEFFGKSTPYDKYLVISNDRYFTITVRYDQFVDTKQRLESLLETLSFFRPSDAGAVRGTATQADPLETVQLIELVKPSVVNILKLQCNGVLTRSPNQLQFLGPSYQFCSGTKGSGLIVTSSGHVATSGHVVKTYPEQALTTNLFEPALEPFLTDLVREVHLIDTQEEISQQQALAVLDGIEENASAVNSLVTLLYELMDQEFFALFEDGVRYVVKVGNDPLTLNEDAIAEGAFLQSVRLASSIFDAELVEVNYPNYFSADVVLRQAIASGPDVAIIKIQHPGNLVFPALPLGDASTLREGSSLVVIGYPDLVEGETSTEVGSILDYRTSSVQATVTRGIVSALKRDENGRQLIQTDAGIDRGNSGGPGLNEKGEVVGLATYGFTSTSGNFNFLRDIAEIKSLMTKHQLDTANNPVYNEWKSALQHFWANSYTKSLKSLSKVSRDYPIHPTANDYLVQATEGIRTGQDIDLIFGMERDRVVALVLILGGAFLTSTIILAVLLAKKYQPPPPHVPALSTLPEMTRSRSIQAAQTGSSIALPPIPDISSLAQPRISVPPVSSASSGQVPSAGHSTPRDEPSG